MSNSDAAPDAGTGTTSAAELPAGVLQRLLVLSKDFKIFTNSRVASSSANEPAASLVTMLQAKDGVLPPQAWQVFTAAVELLCTENGNHTNVNPIAYCQNVQTTLQTLPERVKAIDIRSAYTRYFSPSRSNLLSTTLVGSACRNSLRTLTIEQMIAAHATDHILEGLPLLEQLSLSVYHDAITRFQTRSEIWRPSAPISKQLSLLDVKFNEQCAVLDVSSIGAIASLTFLKLYAQHYINVAAITNLKGLQELCLIEYYLDGYDDLSFLRGLDELRVLTLPSDNLQEDAWQVLAGLPKLTHFVHAGLYLTDAAVSTSITCIGMPHDADDREYVHDLVLPNVPDDLLCGCLGRLVPNLRSLEVHVIVYDIQELLSALRGHTALQGIHILVHQQYGYQISGDDCTDVSTLTALRSFSVGDFVGDLNGLLAVLAGCPSLEEIWLGDGPFPKLQQLDVGDGEQGGLGALARGACSKILRFVKIESHVFKVHDVAAVLRGGLPALEGLEVVVEVPGGWDSAEEVQQGLPQLLLQEGATVAVGVRCWRFCQLCTPWVRTVVPGGWRSALCSLTVLGA